MRISTIVIANTTSFCKKLALNLQNKVVFGLSVLAFPVIL